MILLATCYICVILIVAIGAPVVYLFSMSCKKFLNDYKGHKSRYGNNSNIQNAYYGGRAQKINAFSNQAQPNKSANFFQDEKNLEILTNDIFAETQPKSIPMLYEDLPNNGVVYSNNNVFGVVKTTKHVGQLKLQLSEIEFLTDELHDNQTEAIFVYAGSAPSNHLPKVAELFPNVKFLLVDPHEHVLHFAAKTHSKRHITHLDGEFHSLPEHAEKIVYFKQGKTRFNGSLIDLVTPAGIKRVAKSEELAAREIEDYDEVVRWLVESKHRYYILEDLFTDGLAEALSAITNIPVYFCSDIRTSSNPHSIEMFYDDPAKKPKVDPSKKPDYDPSKKTDYDPSKKPDYDPSPGDIDILWNLAQQLVWLKIMRPKSAMLKFRVPYYNKVESVDNLPPYQMETFTKARELGIDFLGNYAAKKLVYLKCDKIYLQAFAEVYSGETRYVVKNYDVTAELNMKEYENKLYYYNNFERALRYHVGQEWMLNGRAKEIGLDGCGDCALMIEIYKKYYEKYHRDFCNTIEELRRVILEQIADSMFVIDRSLKDNNHTKTKHGHFYKQFKSINDIVHK